ncbi:MAG: hypothetical protein BGN92_04800 [Sphingobacteriales bacterium 41-5]|nr:MAG: hypothetical protein BGN92_04800 [Sphingobacteriales bacterium 41-5]
MNLFRKFFPLTFFLLAFAIAGNTQIVDTAVTRKLLNAKDTLVRPAEENPALKETDSIKLKNPNYRNPRTAALRSAVLPGWGQLYNNKWWKVPIVYAVMGGTAWFFFDNRNIYKELRLGYKVAYNISQFGDSTGYDKIKEIRVKQAVDGGWLNELKAERDAYRKNVDYSFVYFFLAWALNVVDATVDAHLSSFDISPDLSFKIQPGYSELARTSGVSVVLKFK